MVTVTPRSILGAVTLGLAVFASAQSAFHRDTADFSLLQVEAVKTELKLTPAQRTKMNQHAKAYNDFAATLEAKARKGTRPTEADQKRLQTLLGQLRDRVLKELTAAQLRRLSEISLQQGGIVVVGSNEVSRQLKLSASQLKQIRDVISNGLKSSGKLMEDAQSRVDKQFANRKPKNDAEREKLAKEYNARYEAEMKKVAPRVNAIAKDTETKVLGLMTAAQRTAWRNLLGVPFKG